jgi:type III pantothenate kinase
VSMTAPVLELDVGNSAIKWRLLDGGVRVSGGRLESIAELLLSLPVAVQLARIASVADVAREAAIIEQLRAHGIAALVAKSQRECAGVRNAYQDESRMGVDRWLAMVAAYQPFSRASLVIDIGSALTIDFVDADGCHLGGYIIPGVPLLSKALGLHTGRVRFAEAQSFGLAPGVSTEECVHHGKWLAIIGAVREALTWAQEYWAEAYDVFICGGDAMTVMAAFGAQAEGWHYREELVMDGLSYALSARED